MEESKDCNKDDPSGWSFAKGRRIRMIICKWSTPPDDHLQEACPFGWSFARGLSLRMIVSRGRPLQMIICKRPAPPVHHLQEAGPFGWYFDPFRKLEHRKKRFAIPFKWKCVCLKPNSKKCQPDFRMEKKEAFHVKTNFETHIFCASTNCVWITWLWIYGSEVCHTIEYRMYD